MNKNSRKSKKDLTLNLVEREARVVLKMTKITVAEKLKALELLTKVASIRHKIEDGGDGAFFSQ